MPNADPDGSDEPDRQGRDESGRADEENIASQRGEVLAETPEKSSHKLNPVVISLFALLASVCSATASWLSWNTATDSRDIAKSTLDTAGASISIAPWVELGGTCKGNGNALTAIITLRNLGRTDTSVRRTFLSVIADPNLPPGSPPPQSITLNTLGAQSDPVAVKAQDGTEVQIRLDCDALQTNGIDTNDPATALDAVAKEADSRLVVISDSLLNGMSPFQIREVRYLGINYPS